MPPVDAVAMALAKLAERQAGILSAQEQLGQYQDQSNVISSLTAELSKVQDNIQQLVEKAKDISQKRDVLLATLPTAAEIELMINSISL